MNWTAWIWVPLLLAACRPAGHRLDHEVVASHPHDSGCYTQGLEFHGGQLLESGGTYGGSNVRRVDPATGKVLRQRDLPDSVFAEGLTVLGGELWLLTWKAGVVYVLDPQNFELLRRHRYDGEGWGITHDGRHLIMSNGSSRLAVRDPRDFSLLREVPVTERGAPVGQLNELEWVDGQVLANIYTEDRIVRIDPESGMVTGQLELGALRKQLGESSNPPEELNGIARNPETGHLWVTGKYWPVVHELRVGR